MRRVPVLLLLAPAVLAAQPARTSRTVYFPPSLATTPSSCDTGPGVRPTPILSAFENQWYSRHLAAAREPSLYVDASRPRSALSTVRFTWLRSFHQPVFVRVEGLDTPKARLVATELSGAGGYDPGTVKVRIDRALTPAEAEGIRASLQATDVLRSSPTGCELGLDGAQWVVEGVDGSGYHFVSRWSPSSGGVREFGLAMLRVTGWTFKDVY